MLIDSFQIMSFIKNLLSRCGTYAILANWWSPTNAQLDRPYINRMKIKASITELERGHTTSYSMDELKQLLDE